MCTSTLPHSPPTATPIPDCCKGMWELVWFALGALKGWGRTGYKVNIWQNLVNDLIVILYCLQSPITAACQRGPKCGQVVPPSRGTSPLHRGPHSQSVCAHRPLFSHPAKNQQKPSMAIIFTDFFFVCPQGTFSQFNCLRGLFPCGVLFQNVPVKISFWGGRKERMELFF